VSSRNIHRITVSQWTHTQGGAAEIDRWFRSRGFLRGGYHFVINDQGVTQEGRPIAMPAAADPETDANAIAIAVVGESVSSKQKVALVVLRDRLASHLSRPATS